jgi:asparagine synthase (glutamine-hydrolysing)
LLRRNDSELVERALAAPGADLYLDGTAIRHRLAEFGDGETNAPGVEMLMRAVNMGLLAEMAATPPRLAQMSAGPVRVSLAAAPQVKDEDELFDSEHGTPTRRVLTLAEGVQLLTDGQEAWFLLNAGQIEYELEQDSPVLRVLSLLDGTTPFDEALDKSEVDADEVNSDLGHLFTERLLTFKV